MFSNSPRVRQIVYGLAVASQIASFFVAIVNPDLANAFVATAGVLSTVAGVTALTNITPAAPIPGVDSGFIDGNTGFNE